MKSSKLFLTIALAASVFAGSFVFEVVSAKAETTATQQGGIITCGRGQDMCTLCDLIAGMNTIIHYLMQLAIGVALLAMAIGGVMYIVSAGDSGLIDQAKNTMKNAAIGFVIIFAGYLIINTTISYIGAYTNLGIENVGSWGEFKCSRVEKLDTPASQLSTDGIKTNGSGASAGY